ncbi:MAG: TonB-dependent receptor [Candidatus Omnitrophota bacterium]
MEKNKKNRLIFLFFVFCAFSAFETVAKFPKFVILSRCFDRETVAKCLKFVILRLDRRIYEWFIDENRSCAFAQDDKNGTLQQPHSVSADQDKGINLEKIVVTKSNQSLLNVYSLSYSAIENLPVTSVVETLSNTIVDLQSRLLKSGIQTDFSLRGSSFQDVLLLLNGRRINDPQTAHFNSDLPLTRADVESVNVIPGAASSIYGPDAIGGAIDFQVKKPKKNKLILEIQGGSYKTGSALFSVTRKIDNAGLRLSVERQESGGYRYDTDFKKFILNIASSINVPLGEITAGFGYLENEFGAYDFYTPGLGYPSKEWTKTYLLNTSADLKKEGFCIKPSFIWRRHYDKFMLDKTQVRSRYLNHHRNDTYTPAIYAQKETDLLGKLGLGAEYGDERINSTNLGKHSRDHKSVFVDDNKDFLNNFSLKTSFRWDDYSGFNNVYTGSLTLRYKLFEQDCLNLGVSRNMRVPSFTELYYTDPITNNDTALSAEKTINYQLGYDCKKTSWPFGAVVFYRKEKDMIDWVKHSPAEDKFQVENITKDDVLGTEAYIKIKVNDFLNLDCSYTFINKHVFGGDYIYKYGQNYIRHMTNSLFSFKTPFGIQTAGLNYKKKPHRRGWLLFDTLLAYDFNKHSKIFLNITNLLNVEYQEIEGIPQPGRWIEGGLKFDW